MARSGLPRRHENTKNTKLLYLKNSSCLRVFVGAFWQREGPAPRPPTKARKHEEHEAFVLKEFFVPSRLRGRLSAAGGSGAAASHEGTNTRRTRSFSCTRILRAFASSWAPFGSGRVRLRGLPRKHEYTKNSKLFLYKNSSCLRVFVADRRCRCSTCAPLYC